MKVPFTSAQYYLYSLVANLTFASKLTKNPDSLKYVLKNHPQDEVLRVVFYLIRDLPLGALFYHQDHIGRSALHMKTFHQEGNGHKMNSIEVKGGDCLFDNEAECDTTLRIKDNQLLLKEEAHPVIKKFLDEYYVGLGKSYWVLGALVFGDELHVRLRGNTPKDVLNQLPQTFEGFRIVPCHKFARNQKYNAPET